jgi:hypothetical protein
MIFILPFHLVVISVNQSSAVPDTASSKFQLISLLFKSLQRIHPSQMPFGREYVYIGHCWSIGCYTSTHFQILHIGPGFLKLRYASQWYTGIVRQKPWDKNKNPSMNAVK